MNARPLLSPAVHLIRLLLLPASLLLCQTATAFTFTPTQAEWLAWPEYCKARFSSIRNEATFDVSVDPTIVLHWSSVIGKDNFENIHHFCAAMTGLDRAKLAIDPKMRNFILYNAEGDANYSYIRTSHDCPIYGEMATTLARVKAERGRSAEAIQILDKAIEIQPDAASPYLALAMIYKRQKNLPQARAALERGDVATAGQSAELNYFLGLVALQQGDLDVAEKHARIAYSLGYPLPGLRDDLRKRGRWPAN